VYVVYNILICGKVSVHMLIFVKKTGEFKIPRTLYIYIYIFFFFYGKADTNKTGKIKFTELTLSSETIFSLVFSNLLTSHFGVKFVHGRSA
jgi:hypothetical protein